MTIDPVCGCATPVLWLEWADLRAIGGRRSPRRSTGRCIRRTIPVGA